MRTFALTGGIATGKSTVCRMIGELVADAVVFDCDARVGALLNGNRAVAGSIGHRFGPGALTLEGKVNRDFLRHTIYRNPADRLALEEILHPLVHEECLASRKLAAKQGRALFVADVPLLFEKGFDFGQELSLLVATTRATQIRRLKVRNGFGDAMVEAMLAAQLPLSEKLRRADRIFWNEGPAAILHSQVQRFTLSLSTP